MRWLLFSESLGISPSMNVILPQRTSQQIGMEGYCFDGSYAGGQSIKRLGAFRYL